MKQIIKNFNNLIKRTIFKVKNKTNDNFIISSFNKYLITFIGLLFFYLFYLLLPLLYDKAWVQANVESKLRNEFKINLSTSADISYYILPAPHFLIKDSKLLISSGVKEKTIAEIKEFKVFLRQSNFFNKKRMSFRKIIINDANFSVSRSDLKLLNELRNQKFSNKQIKVNNSNIFFKDNLGEIVSIIKIDKTVLFYDNKKQLNFLNSEGKIFNMPFVFDFVNRNDSIKYEKINLRSKVLKLDISNKSTTEKQIKSGENIILFLDSKMHTKYNLKEKLIIFKSDNSRLGNSQVKYNGELSINPFDLSLNVNLDNHKISKLFNINSILIEFIKSGLLFNDNISLNSSIIINSNVKNEIFHNAKINFHIVNGKIDMNKTKFINNKIGSLQLSNSNLFYKNNELVFNSDILVDIKNSENLFSFLNTHKSSRKNLKTILINLEYNFLSGKIKFNNLKVDNNYVDSEFLKMIENFNDIEFNNLNKSRRLLNELLKTYAG